MKKDSFIIPFKSNFFKEQDPFHLVIIFFIIFFGTAIFFSIPTFYDYKKYNQQIEKKINKEFKINFSKLEGTSFRFIPSPHLLIKKANLKIRGDEKFLVSNLENVKVFISIMDLYKSKFRIKRIEINKANLYLNNISFINLIQNLKKNIVNNLEIKKSTLFFKDKNDEVILISTIKNFNYKIDFANQKKILKINGNIFDSDYEFKYLIDYKNPHIQNTDLKLQNPNLLFENKLSENLNSSPFTQNGDLIIQFLNNKNIINYQISGKKIIFKNKFLKNSNFDLNGKVNLSPFDFELTIDLKKINLAQIENFFYSIYQNRNLKFDNLSGKIKINLNNIENKAIKKGILDLEFIDSKIIPINKIFFLEDFGRIEISDYEYLEEGNQILQTKVKVIILDNEKFNRFLFNYKKNKISDKSIYFTYQFNSNTGDSFISSISSNGFINTTEFYKFKNLQQLKYLLKDENIFKLD